MTNKSVLIVEDDPMVLEVNKSFIARITGFTLIAEAQTYKEAYEHIVQSKPDIILLDMYLPDKPGIELLKRIRNEQLPCDVIMITAARDAKSVQDVIRMGAVDYLIKPFRFERFQTALQNYSTKINKLNASSSIKQEDLDEWLGLHNEEDLSLPKGLNDLTMKQIIDGLIKINAPITSEQLAQTVGMARVTVRKYLDYLAGKGTVQIDLKYGTVGRPTKYYSTK